MTPACILLDLRSGNVVTDFASERDAWAALRDWAAADGIASVADLSLHQVREGHPEPIAMEDDLMDRVARALREADAAVQ